MDDDEGSRNCLIHPSSSHILEQCQVFKAMSLEDKKKSINGNLICYICLREHKLPDCTVTSKKCKKCGSKRHHTSFHSYLPKKSLKIKNIKVSNFSASDCSQETKSENSTDVMEEKIPTSLCTSVCGDKKYGKSCGKTLLAKITDPKHFGKVLDAYVILDDQSNTSFADLTVFDFFDAEPNLFGYTLSTLGSKTLNSGRKITGLKIQGALENRTYDLPSLFESRDARH